MTAMAKLKSIPPNCLFVVDTFVTFVCGLWLFVAPNCALGFAIKDQMDGVHWHMARCAGCVLLGQAFASWKFFFQSNSLKPMPYESMVSSIEPVLPTTIIKTRITASVLVILVTWHAKVFHKAHFHSAAPYAILISCLLCIALFLGQLKQSGYQIPQLLHHAKEYVFIHLASLDAFAAMLIGLAWIAVPDLVLRRQVKGGVILATHIWTARFFGSLLFSTQFGSQVAVYLKETTNRKTLTLTRVLTNMGILLAQVFSQMAYGRWWNHSHWLGIALFSFWTSIVCYVAWLFQKLSIH